jgi:hypothetical protein
MLLNAREMVSRRNARKLILLTIEDVTEWCAAKREMAALLRHKEMLLQEVQHRMANSLQIIASIVLRKARMAQSEETRMHLRDAHLRLMSVGAIHQQLLGSSHGDPVYIGPGSLDDGQQSSDLIEGPGGRRHGLVHRGCYRSPSNG